jgi:hypothetical protein
MPFNQGFDMLRLGHILPALLVTTPILAAEPEIAPSPGDGCETQFLEAARKEGAARVTPLLRQCLEEKKQIQAQADGCEASGAEEQQAQLIEAIRRLEAIRTGNTPATEGFDAIAALDRIESFLRKSPTPFAETVPPADPAELARMQAEVERLEAKVIELSGTNEALKREMETMPKPTPEELGLLSTERLQGLVRALLPTGDCDEIEVAVSDSGELSVTGTASSTKAVDEMKARFVPFEKALEKARFAVTLSPGGTCNAPLGNGWSVRPDAAGKVTRLPYSRELESLIESLPTLDECKDLGFRVAQHPVLGPAFAPDLTPRVWCQADGQLGICMRAAYSPNWTFRPNKGHRYTGFAILRTLRK